MPPTERGSRGCEGERGSLGAVSRCCGRAHSLVALSVILVVGNGTFAARVGTRRAAVEVRWDIVSVSSERDCCFMCSRVLLPRCTDQVGVFATEDVTDVCPVCDLDGRFKSIVMYLTG